MRVISAVLASSLALALVGCGNGSEESGGEEGSSVPGRSSDADHDDDGEDNDSDSRDSDDDTDND